MSPLDRWAMKLENHLGSAVLKRSDIIEVNFKSHDSEWSKQFLALLLNTYLDYHSRMTQDPQAEQVFEARAQALKHKPLR